MSGIWLTRLQLVTMTSEVLGYKSGLALSRRELTKLMPKDVRTLWRGDDDAILRLRPEHMEQIIAYALHAVGNIPDHDIAPFGIRVIRKYFRTEAFPVVEDLMPKDARTLWRGDDDAILRLRPEQMEQIIAYALHAVGNIPDHDIAPFGIRVIRKYFRTEAFPVVEDLMKQL